jgi:fatty-acid desaturase
MTPGQVYSLTVHLPVLILTIILSLTLDFRISTFASFIVSYFFVYIVGYNCYHRIFAHRQFKVRPAAEKIIACLGLFSMVGDPLSFAKTHRYHHAHSDTDLDLHNPAHGRFHAAIGWVITNHPRHIPLRYIRDLLSLEYNYLRFIMKYQILIIYVVLAIIALINLSILHGLLLVMCTAWIKEMASNSLIDHSPTLGRPVNNPIYCALSLTTPHQSHHMNSNKITNDDTGIYLYRMFNLFYLIDHQKK